LKPKASLNPKPKIQPNKPIPTNLQNDLPLPNGDFQAWLLFGDNGGYSIAKDKWTRIRAWVSLKHETIKERLRGRGGDIPPANPITKKGPIPGKCKRQLGKGPTTKKCSELPHVLLVSHDLHTNGPRY
jgi:hypothetical protein